MANKRLVVKAVLQYPEGLELGSSPDIRRFRLTKEGADDKGDMYCRLVDNLCTVFPDINGVNYSLHWKDDEGDLVQFSSLGELQAAIDAMSGHVLHVYVIVHFDDIEETTDSETEDQADPAAGKKGSKRVRFARAGRKFRRKVRRRRRSALSDPTEISKEFRTGARVLLRHLHQAAQDGDAAALSEQGAASLAELSPEVREFIRQTHDEWHSKLASQRPTIVARRMRMKERSLPPGLERDHFLWLLRMIGRWHRRHAGQCRAMAGWSSDDTEADESSGEEKVLRAMKMKKMKRRAKKKSAAKGAAPPVEEEGVGEEPQESDKVTKTFRQAVRVLMKRIHASKDAKPADDQEKATLAALKPDVQSLVRKIAEDWHAMLAEKKPSLVAKRMRKRKRTLPADLQREHYLWLCRYFRRWHSRHAARCSVMSGWSSGADDDDDDDDDVTDGDEEKETKGEASSESDAEDAKKTKKAVPKEFVKATRILVNRIHDKKTARKGDKAALSEEETTLAALSKEARDFVQSFAEEWDRMLAKKGPVLVAKRMRRKPTTTTLPKGLEENHVVFLCRFLARWHKKHAALCGAMGDWSSAESGGEATSGEEKEELLALKRRAGRAGLLEVSTASEQDDTDCVDMACKPVSKEFRAGVRQCLNQLHKKPAAADTGKKPEKAAKVKDDKEKITLSPEVQRFLQSFAEEWHSKLASSRPRAVSKEMKGRSVSLPARMDREQYTWLCCFMARWHRKHAAKCDVISEAITAEVQG